MTKWDERWMSQAQNVSTWSRDPRRKVGCIIVDSDNNQLSGGYNGFPRKIADDSRLLNRKLKLKMVVHAEANAVAKAARKGHSLEGGIAYITHNPCSQCACLLIQSGIQKVVFQKQPGYSVDWEDDFNLAISLLREAGVSVEQIEPIKPPGYMERLFKKEGNFRV